MKKIIEIIVTFLIFITSATGEVTDKEWTRGGLRVTYYVGDVGLTERVECTAYNHKGKPIGGGSVSAMMGQIKGGIALVTIRVPQKYQGGDLGVRCYRKDQYIPRY